MFAVGLMKRTRMDDDEDRTHAPSRHAVTIAFGASGRTQPASGPVQSLFSLIESLKGEFELSLVANQSIRPSGLESGPVEVCSYANGIRYYWYGDRYGPAKARKLISRDTSASLLMLNSFFDREFTLPILWRRKLGLIPKRPILLSPRGEFARGALSLKARRKRAYIALAKRLALLDDVWLHATEAHEVEDIRRMGLKCRGVIEAPDPRQWFACPPATAPEGDISEERPLELAFLGRITPVKNVLFAIDAMAHVEAPARLDLFGPIADADYWCQCETAIAALPAHIQVRAHGALPHERVPETLAGYDLFFLPTLGENFGHAIHEALMSGLPILISDTTAWRGLEEAGAGWDLPLGDPQSFATHIDTVAALAPAARMDLRRNARDLAERRFHESQAVSAHRDMFLRVIEAEA